MKTALKHQKFKLVIKNIKHFILFNSKSRFVESTRFQTILSTTFFRQESRSEFSVKD